jgi:hypothetical protein
MSSPQVQGTILLIGDQDEVHATRAEGLRRQGYQVLTAAPAPGGGLSRDEPPGRMHDRGRHATAQGAW